MNLKNLIRESEEIMNLKNLIRERFAEKIGLRTRWYHGEALAALDEVLNEISPLEEIETVEIIQTEMGSTILTRSEQYNISKQNKATVVVKDLTPAEAEAAIASMKQASQQIESMDIDLSEPQDNAEVIGRLKTHTEEERKKPVPPSVPYIPYSGIEFVNDLTPEQAEAEVALMKFKAEEAANASSTSLR